ncbi:hypothetical protein DVH24_036544 [Malus domestica]|uniref:Uncharacterized protein n=1 Tax=Malus domestica TaxID=3750 RepID=A0A498ILV2_MALDO|nr:hypothetical protein DVH24_036544 [Malus domestica]
MNLDRLPGDCFGHILSFTSPGDACQSFAIRPQRDSIQMSSKDFFMKLCSPSLIDDGDKLLATNPSGFVHQHLAPSVEIDTKSYVGSLSFFHITTFNFTTSTVNHASGGNKYSYAITENAYGAYLTIKLANCAYGLDTLSYEVSLEVGNFKSQGAIYLSKHDDQSRKQASSEHEHFPKAVRASRSRIVDGGDCGGGLCERADGCDEKDATMSLREVKGVHLKVD